MGFASQRSLKVRKGVRRVKENLKRALHLFRSLGSRLLLGSMSLLAHGLVDGTKMAIGFMVGLWITLMIGYYILKDGWPFIVWSFKLSYKLISSILGLLF